MRLPILILLAAILCPAQEIMSHPKAAPVSIRKVDPQYTKEAIDAKLEGSIRLSAVVGIDGIPSEIVVTRGLGKGLDEKAVECLRQWRFKPGLVDFKPAPVKVTVELTFRLPRG